MKDNFLPIIDSAHLFGNNCELREESGMTQEDLLKERSILSTNVADAGRAVHFSQQELIKILDELFPSVTKVITDDGFYNKGDEGIREWIQKQLIDNFEPSFLRGFLEDNLGLDPITFMNVYQLTSDITFLCKKTNECEQEELTRKHFQDKSIFKKIVSKNRNLFRKHYGEKMYKYLFPSIDVDFPISEKSNEEVFNHPLVEMVCDYQKRKGNKSTTIQNNTRYPVYRFFKWLCTVQQDFFEYKVNDLPPGRIREEHLRDYRKYILREINEGRSELGAKKDFQFVKGFFKKLYLLDLIPKNKFNLIPNIKAGEYKFRYVPDLLTLESFFKTLKIFAREETSECLAFGLMLFMGFRVSEVANLKWSAVDLDKQTICFERKGGEIKTLSMPTIILELFSSLLSKAKSETENVFSHNPRNYISYLSLRFKLYSMLSNWKNNEGVHLFRHTFSTYIANYGVSPRVGMYLTSHDSIDSYSKYVHKNQEELQRKVDLIKL